MKRWRALVALVPFLAVAACAVQPPTAEGTPATAMSPATSVTPSSLTPTPSASPSAGTPSSSATPTGSASPAAPPTVTPQAGAILLGPSGLGTMKFGTAEKGAVAALKEQLGDPDDVYRGAFCELDKKSPYSATYTYGGLSVIFLAKNTKSTSARVLRGWTYDLSEGLNDSFEMYGDLPADPTFDQLRQAYPKGKLSQGDTGTTFTLPNGLRFTGAAEPDFMDAGTTAGCD